MSNFADHPVMSAVRSALGRKKTPTEVPPPPELPDPLIRLVHTDIGLAELFGARAKENKMTVHFVSPDDVAEKVVSQAKSLGLASIVFPVSPLLEKLGIPAALNAAGVTLLRWDDPATKVLDASYDVDAGLTDAWAAVAETGSVVLRASPGHGRAISLVPAYHLVVIEPKIILPDLVDLFEKMATVPPSSGTVIITGPSKTADIEMNLVTGVHGPGHVEIFILK